MTPGNMRPGDRVVIGEGRGRRYVEIAAIDPFDAVPGMAEFTWTATFTDGSGSLMARNKDYKTWIDKGSADSRRII